MPDEVSSVKLLFEECNKTNPDMIKIDEYIICICNNKDDINLRFQCYKWTPLHVACQWGHHDIVKRLLDNSNTFKYPIDVNAIGGSCDETPLHFACREQSSLTVRTLLLHPEIEVKKGNSFNSTPLHVACLQGRKEIVIELLMHRNITLNVKNIWFATPLHHACYYKDSASIAQLRLEHATITDIINATDKDGNTPLQKACSRYTINKEMTDTIRNLLKQPSIISNKINNNNETPFEICKRKLDNSSCELDKQYYIEIIQLFEEYHSQQRWRAFCFLINYEY